MLSRLVKHIECLVLIMLSEQREIVETHSEIVGQHRDRQLSYVEELKRLRGVVEKVSKYADDRAAHTRGICHSVRVASDLRAILECLDVGDSGV